MNERTLTPGVPERHGEHRRLWPGGDQILLRGLVPLGVLISMVAAIAAGGRPAQWVQLVVVALSLVATLRPDSSVATGALLGSTYVWTTAPQTLTPLLLVGAAGMLLTHVAALLAAQGPALVALDPAQARRWTGRAGLLLLAAATVWGLARLFDGQGGGRLVYAAGLIVLSAISGLMTWLLTRRTGERALSTSRGPA